MLNLYGNQICDSGAKYIADVLRLNSTLRILSLEANQIGDDGFAHLTEALKYNSTITRLNLEDNNCSSEQLSILNQRLKQNKTNFSPSPKAKTKKSRSRGEDRIQRGGGRERSMFIILTGAIVVLAILVTTLISK